MAQLHESPRPIETDPASGAPLTEPDGPAVWDAFVQEGPEIDTAPQPSAFRFVIGLAVIWGSLFLIAWAQKISFNEIRFDFGDNSPTQRAQTFVKQLDVRDKVMTPMDVRFHRTPARQIVKLLLAQTGIAVDGDDLALVSETPVRVEIPKRPLYYQLHSVINDPQIGFSIQERRAHFFPQTLKAAEPPTGLLRTFDWAADVELSPDPTLIFPSIRSDLWLLLSLEPSAVGPAPYQTRVRVEVWRGGERFATAEDVLSETSKATLDFTAGGKVRVTIEPSARTVAPQTSGPSKYKVRIYFEARAEGGDMPAALPSSEPQPSGSI